MPADQEVVPTDQEDKYPKDIPKQGEFSSVLQQCKAPMDIQIELFGRWERVT